MKSYTKHELFGEKYVFNDGPPMSASAYRDALLALLRAPTPWLTKYLRLVVHKVTEGRGKHLRLTLSMLSQYLNPDAILEPSPQGFRVPTSYFTDYSVAALTVMDDAAETLSRRHVDLSWEDQHFLRCMFSDIGIRLWWDVFFVLYSGKESTIKNAYIEAKKGAVSFKVAFLATAGKLYAEAAEFDDTYEDIAYLHKETHEDHFIRHYNPQQLLLNFGDDDNIDDEW